MYELKLPSVFRVKALDTTVLIYHLFKSAEEHGNLDANYTLSQLRQRLGFTIEIPTDVLESALFSCNMLEERGQFWSPEKEEFQAFVTRLTGGRKFHPVYNWIEEKET